MKPFCFLITRLGMEQTSSAAMASLFGEWFDPDAALDSPIGGSRAVVEALVHGLELQAGRLQCRSPVVESLVGRRQATPACASSLQWHLGLRGDDLAELLINQVSVGDW
ncbi:MULTISPECIES: hypothetical protein [unclassified Cyanobium]|uniref:hypothetical protein n=1 Tax=unclassified Cyanobium TaxID=2627006 RepID=UPI0020CC73B9|nr:MULTISPECIES: hypothetical protein [unclassified Cyanobium]MCP9777907.1 hypothetical protein [Cyanobium sp. Tous-M-B4]MCP9875594.1 hypothetical protein [Cyanobium sp. A2C-AMD]